MRFRAAVGLVLLAIAFVAAATGFANRADGSAQCIETRAGRLLHRDGRLGKCHPLFGGCAAGLPDRGEGAGGADECSPGPRGNYGFYGCYFRDPEGNKICAYVPA